MMPTDADPLQNIAMFSPASHASVVPLVGKNGSVLSEKERAKIAKKKGVCLNCGVKTHKVSLLSRSAITNENVHKGLCIGCNPNEVPHGVLLEYQNRNTKQAPATTISSGSSGVPLPKPKNRSTGSTNNPGARLANKPAAAIPAPRSPKPAPRSPKPASRSPKPAAKKPPSSSGDDYEAPIVYEPEEVRLARAKAWQQVAGAKLEHAQAEERANEALTRLQESQAAKPAPKEADTSGDDYEASLAYDSEDVRMAEERATEARTKLQGFQADGPAATNLDQHEVEEQFNQTLTGLHKNQASEPASKPASTSNYYDGAPVANDAFPDPGDHPQVATIEELQLKVVVPPEQNFTITLHNVSHETTVKKFKEEIQKRKGIPVKQQELCLGYETLLFDNETLSHYNLLVPNNDATVTMFHADGFPCRQVLIDLFGEKHKIPIDDPGHDNIECVLQAIQSRPWFTDQLRYMSPEEVERINLRLSWGGLPLNYPSITLVDLEIPNEATLDLEVFQDDTVYDYGVASEKEPPTDDKIARVAQLQQELFGSYQN